MINARALLITDLTSLSTLVENLKSPQPLSFRSSMISSISRVSILNRKNEFRLRFRRKLSGDLLLGGISETNLSAIFV